MAHRIQIARAWCDECLSQCWFSFDEATQISEHLGESNAQQWDQLKTKGYYCKHTGGSAFTFTLYKSQPLALPIDWQFINDRYDRMDRARTEELLNQDW